MAGNFRNVTESLRNQFAVQRARTACIFLADGRTETASISYSELDRAALECATRLQELGAVNERVLLLLPTGIEYVVGLLGCLYAGAIAVPAFPIQPSSLERLRRIAEDAQPRIVLTGREAGCHDDVRSFLGQDTRVLRLPLSEPEEASEGSIEYQGPDQLALLQYTSGSTYSPKGVMVTHGNLAANAAAIAAACGHSEETHFVGWMPLFHDMGLIGNVLQPLFVGALCILMPPTAFLRRPYNWLRAISRYHAHTSGGPDFAYQHCLREVRAEDCDGLDLSSWKVAFNGSEPVRAETLDGFARRFAPWGLRRSALFPTYGMAEATLFITGPRAGEEPRYHRRVKEELMRVSCGWPWNNTEVMIADALSGKPCTEGETGEVWIRGPQVARGYWNNAEATKAAFDATAADGGTGFLRTGDLGYLHQGCLYVTGRLKDILVLRGRNVAANDIERVACVAVGHGTALRSAAFAIRACGEERAAVLIEIRKRVGGNSFPDASNSIREALARELGLDPEIVGFLRPGVLPVTTSGKVRRREACLAFVAGKLPMLFVWRAKPGECVPRKNLADLLRVPEYRRKEALWNWLSILLAGNSRDAGRTITPETSIDSLGIDSLRAVRLQHAIETGLGIDLPANLLLNGGTVSEQVEAIWIKLRGSSPALPRSQFTGVNPEEQVIAPASAGQKSIWYLYNTSPRGSALHLAFLAVFPEKEPAVSVVAAAEAIWRRHPSLRYRFEMREGLLVRLLSNGHAPLEEKLDTDYTCEVGQREVARRFDLAEEPPVRLTLYRNPQGGIALLVVVHHIAADYWSLTRLALELADRSGRERLQPALELGQTPPRPESLDYWRGKLLPPPADLILSSAAAQPATGYRPCGSVPFETKVPTDDIRRFALAEGCSLFTVLLACFQLLLHELSGESDILMGTPVHCRAAPELSEAVGYLVNPVVLRSSLVAGETFSGYLRRVRDSLREALAHQCYPFATLVEDLGISTKRGNNPLFDAVFLFYESPVEGKEELAALALGHDVVVSIGQIAFSRVMPAEPEGLYQLELSLALVNDRVQGVCKYDLDRISGEACKQWMARYGELLELACHQPERVLVAASCESVAISDGNVCLHSLFERQVVRDPSAPAVVFEESQWSYRELNERANQAAHAILAVTKGQQVTVAILLAPGPWQIAALLGVLKAGCAFAGLSLDQPSERIGRILAVACPAIVITENEQRNRMPPVTAATVLLISVLPQGETANPNLSVMPGDRAYIALTSGSTGMPKGIVQTHENLVQFLQWQAAEFGIRAGSRMAQLAPVTFDVSYCEIFGSLCFGGAVCVPSAKDRVAGRFSTWLARARVSILQMVPSVFQQLSRDGADLDVCQELKTVLFVGEGVPVGLAKTLLKRFPESPVFHTIYGPTETVAATCHRIKSVPEDAAHIAIGKPIAGRAVFILDERGEPCPANVKGEIYVVSSFLSPGYLQQPEETKRRFVTLQWSGQRAYRTGDLGTWLVNGDIQFGGRLDNQVKIHGVRVEIEEVEAALKCCDGVADCGVLATRNAHGNWELSAYLETVEAIRVNYLVSSLQGQLPLSMIPSRFYRVRALPRNAHGKLDRELLRSVPASQIGTLEDADWQEWSVVEQEIATIWRHELQIPNVGRTDPFFVLGGHSLQAAVIMNRLQERFGVDLRIGDFLADPTVAGCARLIQTERACRRDVEEEASRILTLVESLTEKEVKRLLRESKGETA